MSRFALGLRRVRTAVLLLGLALRPNSAHAQNDIKIRDLTGPEAVKREMALICVNAASGHRAEILRIVDIFRCKVVDVGLEHYIIEVTGDAGKIGALVKLACRQCRGCVCPCIRSAKGHHGSGAGSSGRARHGARRGVGRAPQAQPRRALAASR